MTAVARPVLPRTVATSPWIAVSVVLVGAFTATLDSCVVLVTGGRLGDVFGRRRLLLVDLCLVLSEADRPRALERLGVALGLQPTSHERPQDGEPAQ